MSRTAEVNIPLTADGEQLRRDLAVKVAEVERLTRIEIPVDAKEAADFRQKVAAAVAEVEALARAASPEIVVNTRVDRRGLAGLGGVARAITGISVTATRVASTFALWGSLIAGVVGLVAILAPAFALVLPAVLALGAGIGVIMAGADGLQKALGPLIHRFQDLAPALSKTLSRGIHPLAAALAPRLVNAISGGLTSVASSLNLIVRRTLTFLNTTAALQLVREISTGIAGSFRQLADVAAPLTKAFLQLTASSLPAFAALSRALASSSIRFAEWVDRATASGAASRAISTAFTALGAIFRVVGSVLATVVRAFVSLGPVAITVAESVGRLVDGVVAMTAPIIRFVAANRELSAVLATVGLALAAAFGGPVTAIVAGVILAARVFDLLRGRMDGIAQALRPLINGFQSFTRDLRAGFNTIVPGLITFAQAVGPVLVDLGRKLVSTVGPALASLGETLRTKVAPAIARFLVAVAPVAAVLLRAFGTSVIAAIKGVFQVIEQLAVILAGVLDVLTGLLTGDWARLWDGAKTVVSGFASGVVAILRAAMLLPSMQVLRELTGAIVGFFTSIASTVATAAVGATQAALSVIGGFFSALASAIAGFFTGIATAVAGAFTSVVSAVAGVASAISGVLAAAFTATVGVLTHIWSEFWSGAFGQLVIASLQLVLAAVRLHFTILASVFAAALGAILVAVRVAWDAIKAVVSAVTSAIVAVVSAGWRAASAVVSAVVRTIRAVVTAAFNAIVAVVRSTMTATQSVISAVWNAIRPFVQGAVAAVVAAVRQISQVAAIVGNAFQAAYDAAVAKVGHLVSLAAGLGGRIVGALGNFGSLLYHAGQELIGGLINGITSRIRAVTSLINSLTSKIAGAFPGSPVKTGPLRSFNGGGAGRELIKLLAAGLNDSGPVDVAVNRLSSKIASVAAGGAAPPTRMSPSPAAAGAGAGITVNTYNPAPETPSETVTRSMRRLSALGLAATA